MPLSSNNVMTDEGKGEGEGDTGVMNVSQLVVDVDEKVLCYAPGGVEPPTL